MPTKSPLFGLAFDLNCNLHDHASKSCSPTPQNPEGIEPLDPGSGSTHSSSSIVSHLCSRQSLEGVGLRPM